MVERCSVHIGVSLEARDDASSCGQRATGHSKLNDDESAAKVAIGPTRNLVIVTLVHGTFSPDAEWTRRGSSFRIELADRLSGLGHVHLRRFTWSGANNLFDRFDAEIALRRNISRIHSRFPDAQHFVVAHSHGGNIASGLLTGDRQPGVTGIACLATPFFHLRFREEALDQTLLSRSWVGILSLCAFITAQMVHLNWWVQFIVIAGCVFVGSSVGAFLSGGLSAIAAPAREFVAGAQPRRRMPLLNLRGAGDEAAFALSFGQMVDWICSSMHRRVVMRAGRPRGTIVSGRWTAVIGLWALCAATALFLSFGIYSVEGSQQAGGPWFAVIGTVAILGPFMMKTHWLDNLSLGLLAILSVGSTVFTKSWFGSAIPDSWGSSSLQRLLPNLLLPMLLEVRTEAAPPGSWEVTYLPPAPLLPDPVEGRLTHGIYDHPKCRELLADWIIDLTSVEGSSADRTDKL